MDQGRARAWARGGAFLALVAGLNIVLVAIDWADGQRRVPGGAGVLAAVSFAVALGVGAVRFASRFDDREQDVLRRRALRTTTIPDGLDLPAWLPTLRRAARVGPYDWFLGLLATYLLVIGVLPVFRMSGEPPSRVIVVLLLGLVPCPVLMTPLVVLRRRQKRRSRALLEHIERPEPR